MVVWTAQHMEKMELRGKVSAEGGKRTSDVLLGCLDVGLAPCVRAVCSDTARQTNVCSLSRQPLKVRLESSGFKQLLHTLTLQGP